VFCFFLFVEDFFLWLVGLHGCFIYGNYRLFQQIVCRSLACTVGLAFRSLFLLQLFEVDRKLDLFLLSCCGKFLWSFSIPGTGGSAVI